MKYDQVWTLGMVLMQQTSSVEIEQINAMNDEWMKNSIRHLLICPLNDVIAA